MNDHIMIVCADKPSPGVEGHYSKCCICISVIYVSNSTYRAIDKNGYFKEDCKFYCFKCSLPKMKTVKEFVPFTEDQKQEIFLSQWKGDRHDA